MAAEWRPKYEVGYMRTRNLRATIGLLSATAVLVAACSTTAPATQAPASQAPASAPASQAPSSQAPTEATVRLQLQWEPQAQFAGYFAADREGYYAEEGLTVEFVRGGADILPH